MFSVRLRSLIRGQAFRPAASVLARVIACVMVGSVFAGANRLAANGAGYDHPSCANFRHLMPKTIRADHPAILPVAAAIRAVTDDPLEQLVMVNDVTHLLVDYDDDARVYGKIDYHATLDEMLERRRQGGWLYLRDDCDGRAVFAAHLLASLGIPWRLEASNWKHHAWVTARVGGVVYDLLDFHPDVPEQTDLSYRLIGRWVVAPSHPPPPFDWRRRWAERTGKNLSIGWRLGMLTLDSTPDHLSERHATDWTRQCPGGTISPFDPRMLTASCAGFPYGETLHVGALAATEPTPMSLAAAASHSAAPLAGASELLALPSAK